MKSNVKEENWTLRVRLLTAADQLPEGTVLLSVGGEDRPAVCLYRKAETFLYELRTDAAKEPLVLEAEAVSGTKELELLWLGYRAELRENGVLRDEEWPDGICLADDSPCIFSREEYLQVEWRPYAAVKEPVCESIPDIRYWAPELGRHNVGDCMPFADSGTYHLFYLKDRHQHKSKWGKGAHQFAHISTTDLVHWQEHPAAVEITHQWEGSICTGSVIRAGEEYYAFYAVRMTDASSARISYATSEDCIHFTKSERYFTLTAPYETTSVRDPEVFWGADGQYHMLVTTNLEADSVPERSGCLAHLVSADLKNWEQKAPFLVPGYTDQPECCDYFEWNGWYYLIFSNYGTAKYRYSRQPFGPWSCPENEMIDGLLYRVPKTAEFCGRRIASGFLCINTEGNSYAGSLVLRELKQNPDGTLGSCFVQEILPQTDGGQADSGTETAGSDSTASGKNMPDRTEKGKVLLDSGDQGGYRQEAFAAGQGYVKLKICTTDRAGNFGLILHAPGKQAYEIRIDPTQRTLGVYQAHSCLYYNPTKRILTGLQGLENGCDLEVILQGDVLDICVNQARTLVCRMEESYRDGSVDWTCFVKDKRAEFVLL